MKRELSLWTVGETIGEEHRPSIQFPDSKTELGYETAGTPQERKDLADRITGLPGATVPSTILSRKLFKEQSGQSMNGHDARCITINS